MSQTRVYPPTDLVIAERSRDQVAGAGDVVGRHVLGERSRVLYTPLLGLVFISGADARREGGEGDLGR